MSSETNTNSVVAVVRTSGSQHVVTTGERLTLNRMTGDVGALVSLGDVLAVQNGESVSLGTPVLNGASVTGKILRHFRGPKVVIFKKRRRKGYTKTQGHRQDLTEIQIESIKG